MNRFVFKRMAAIALMTCAGCQLFDKPVDKPGPAITATTGPVGPAVKMATFDGSAQYGITVAYPADWKVAKDDSALKVVSPDGAANFYLYYQKLGMVEANFATAARADSHYQDDRKKDWCPDATVAVDTPISIPDADARKIVMNGHKGGKTLTSTAAFMIRKGQVYVLTVESPQGDPVAAQVFNQAVASIHWTK